MQTGPKTGSNVNKFVLFVFLLFFFFCLFVVFFFVLFFLFVFFFVVVVVFLLFFLFVCLFFCCCFFFFFFFKFNFIPWLTGFYRTIICRISKNFGPAQFVGLAMFVGLIPESHKLG